MFSRVIVSSLLLAALANGLVIKRDDGIYSSSTPPVTSLPTTTPHPILLPEPSISLSLPPLDQSSNVIPTDTLPLPSSLPSVVTTTVYFYPTQCSSTPSGSPLPPADPSGVPGSVTTLPNDGPPTLPTPVQPSPLNLPQESPLNLPPVRRDDAVISQLRTLQQQVVNTFANIGKGDIMLNVIGEIESLIAQAIAPGTDGDALLKQAQDLVNDS